jgi:dethiobiotin synthetase
MGQGVFITGTDTGVGKTLVTAGIVRWLRNQGIDAVPMKPVQTGGERRSEARGDRLVSPDLKFALAAADLQPDHAEMKLMSPYVYLPACSPHLAGRMAKRYMEPSVVRNCANGLLRGHQAVIVEGAGGIMVPINESDTMLDLMKILAYPVVLVSRVSLGTINHTLLSIHALRVSGVSLIGVVFNQMEQSSTENRFIEEDNPGTVARFGKVPVLGKIMHFDPESKTEETWRDFEKSMTGLPDIRDALGCDTNESA